VIARLDDIIASVAWQRCVNGARKWPIRAAAEAEAKLNNGAPSGQGSFRVSLADVAGVNLCFDKPPGAAVCEW
jgi:hypothetical protein